MVHHSLPPGSKLPVDVPKSENARNDEFKQLKEEQDHFQEEVNFYNMHNEKHEKSMLKKEVAVKANTRNGLDVKKTGNLRETEKHVFKKTNEELVFCSLNTSSSGTRSAEEFFKRILPLYLRLPVDVERVVRRYRNRAIFEPLPATSK